MTRKTMKAKASHANRARIERAEARFQSNSSDSGFSNLPYRRDIGSTSKVSAVDVNNPPNMTIAIGPAISRPVPRCQVRASYNLIETLRRQKHERIAWICSVLAGSPFTSRPPSSSRSSGSYSRPSLRYKSVPNAPCSARPWPSTSLIISARASFDPLGALRLIRRSKSAECVGTLPQMPPWKSPRRSSSSRSGCGIGKCPNREARGWRSSWSQVWRFHSRLEF